jgi:hypothetical protein
MLAESLQTDLALAESDVAHEHLCLRFWSVQCPTFCESRGDHQHGAALRSAGAALLKGGGSPETWRQCRENRGRTLDLGIVSRLGLITGSVCAVGQEKAIALLLYP